MNEDLKLQIDQETELAEELENQIRSEKESHEVFVRSMIGLGRTSSVKHGKI